MCTVDTKCPIIYWLAETDPKRLQHIEETRHTCKWGAACKTKWEKGHSRDFVHMEKEKCPDDDMCNFIDDQKHRAQKSHKGLWDFMVPCKVHHSGKKCTACENDDKKRYYH